MSKYAVVLPYVHTPDSGQELRYMLRSLKNVTNWNGEAIVIGDREPWFTDKIQHIKVKRIFGKPYYDQVNKFLFALDELPSQFIATNDDIFVTEPTEIKAYHKGILDGEGRSYHARTKAATKQLLNSRSIDQPLDFECHTPMLVDRFALGEIIKLIITQPNKNMLQWRSLYGNIHSVESELIEDKKTKTPKLPKGSIISTACYTSELDKMFPEKSIYEQ